MDANERTSLLQHANQNGNGVIKKKNKLIIPMPKDPIFVFEDYFGGLTLNELLPYQDHPWWKRLRNIMLYCLWLIFTLTFAWACITAYLHRENTCKALLPVPLATSTASLTEVLSSSSGSAGGGVLALPT